jgi:hypothetical protein
MRRAFQFLSLVFLYLLLLPISKAQTSTLTWNSGTSPSYAVTTISGAYTWVWPDAIPTWYSPTSFTVDINLTDSQSHLISFYLIDEDSTARSESISVTNVSTGAALFPPQTFSNFHSGITPSWTVSGHVRFTITYISGANAVLTSITFSTPVTCPIPVHSAVIAWQPSTSPGVTGYNVYQNGVKITSTPIPSSPYTVTGLTAGASIVFNVTAVSSSGESAYSTLPTITVPTP